MDLHQQRKNDLEEFIKKDLNLQKQLEDDLRLAQEPQQKEKLNKQIEEIKTRIATYEGEIGSLHGSKQKQESLVNAMTAITFRELQMVTQGILCMPIPAETNYVVLPPVKKMLKNQLTGTAQSRLMTGVIQARMVGSFVENMINIIPDYPERIKAALVIEYRKLRAEGLEGNALFEALHKFSCGHSLDYDLQAAGLAVLYYFFEKCEIFER